MTLIDRVWSTREVGFAYKIQRGKHWCWRGQTMLWLVRIPIVCSGSTLWDQKLQEKLLIEAYGKKLVCQCWSTSRELESCPPHQLTTFATTEPPTPIASTDKSPTCGTSRWIGLERNCPFISIMKLPGMIGWVTKRCNYGSRRLARSWRALVVLDHTFAMKRSLAYGAWSKRRSTKSNQKEKLIGSNAFF